MHTFVSSTLMAPNEASSEQISCDTTPPCSSQMASNTLRQPTRSLCTRVSVVVVRHLHAMKSSVATLGCLQAPHRTQRTMHPRCHSHASLTPTLAPTLALAHTRARLRIDRSPSALALSDIGHKALMPYVKLEANPAWLAMETDLSSSPPPTNALLYTIPFLCHWSSTEPYRR